MKYYLLIVKLFLLTAFNVTSQPVLNNIEDFSIGERSTYVNAEKAQVSPGTAGAQITWDFKNLTSIDSQQYKIIHPDSTSYKGQFKNADLVEVSPDGSYVFQEIKNDTNQVWGNVNNSNTVIRYSDPYQFLFRPITFLDSLVDTARRSYKTSGIKYEGTGIVKTKVDGYGTLKVPNGTFSNVLRIKIEQLFKDTAQSSGSVTTSRIITYTWFDEDHKSALLRWDSTIINSDFFKDTSKTVKYLIKETYTGLMDNALQKEKGNLEGYLCQDESLCLSYPFVGGETIHVKVFDLSGKVVFKNEIKNKNETRNLKVDLRSYLSNKFNLIHVLIKKESHISQTTLKTFR